MIDQQGEGLVFLLSTPRAGSTLLAATLGSHSQILCPPEPWLLLGFQAMRNPLATVSAPWDHELTRQALSDLAPEKAYEEGRQAAALAVYRRLMDEAGNSRYFVDKTPRYYHVLAELDRLFPAARKLWLNRDPLDVAASCKQTWKIPVEELVGLAPSAHSFDLTLGPLFLLDYLQAGGDDRREVRYENLVADPEGQVRQICQWLCVEFEPAMLAYGQNQSLVDSYARHAMGDKNLLSHDKAHGGSVGRWRERLTAREVELLLKTLGSDLMNRLGYGRTLAEAAAWAGIDPAEIAPQGELQRLKSLREGFGASRSPGTAQLHRLEEDRASRLEVIESQGARISRLLEEQAELHRQLEAARQEAENFTAERDAARRKWEEAERDREARLAVIQRQGEELGKLGAQQKGNEQLILQQQQELQRLGAALEAEGKRSSDLEKALAQLEANRLEQAALLEGQKSQMAASQRRETELGEEIASLGDKVSTLQREAARLQGHWLVRLRGILRPGKNPRNSQKGPAQ